MTVKQVKVNSSVVALHYNIGRGALLNQQEQLNALRLFLNQHYACDCPFNFASRLYEVIVDVAFCQRNKHWFTLRIIREVNIFLHHYGYEDFSEWAQYAQHLPTPFLTKEEANNYLSSQKLNVFKSMILQCARRIHSLFYAIAEAEIDEIVPHNLIDKLSMETLYEIEVLVETIVHNQAKATLESKGYKTWEDWENSIKKENLSE